MTKLEAIARQNARITDKPEPFKPWERNETLAIARLDQFRVIRFQHRRRVLKSGHM